MLHRVKFNVRTLNRISQLTEQTSSVVGHKIGIVCIQEHRYHHSEVEIKYHDIGNGWMFVSASTWRNSVKTIIRGIGMLLCSHALKFLNSFEKIKPRMMVATLTASPAQ